MSDAGGTSATGVVVRGGNRTVEVCIPLVCLHPDGQFKYEVTATCRLVIPAGDLLPVFTPKGLAYCLEVSRVPPVSGGAPDPGPTRVGYDPVELRDPTELPPWMRLRSFPKLELRANAVCRSPLGDVKWVADTEPIGIDPARPLALDLALINTVVDARPTGVATHQRFPVVDTYPLPGNPEDSSGY